MKNIILYLLLVFLSLSFFSCSNNDETVPQVFSEGYIEANIEDNFYKKDFKLTNLKDASIGSINYDNSNYTIDFVLKMNNLNDRIILTINNVKDAGVFEIKGNTSTSISFYDGKKDKIYHTNYNLGSGVSVGKIVVSKFDTENKVIEGTFEGRLLEAKDKSSTILITEGKFSGTYLNIGL